MHLLLLSLIVPSETLLSRVLFSSIMNSLVIVLFLSGMVAMIMLRTLHKDIARYNQLETSVSCAFHIACFPLYCSMCLMSITSIVRYTVSSVVSQLSFANQLFKSMLNNRIQ